MFLASFTQILEALHITGLGENPLFWMWINSGQFTFRVRSFITGGGDRDESGGRVYEKSMTYEGGLQIILHSTRGSEKFWSFTQSLWKIFTRGQGYRKIVQILQDFDPVPPSGSSDHENTWLIMIQWTLSLVWNKIRSFGDENLSGHNLGNPLKFCAHFPNFEQL